MTDPKLGHPKLVCSSLLAYQLPIVKAPPCKLLFPVEHSFNVVRIHIKAAFPKCQSCVRVCIYIHIFGGKFLYNVVLVSACTAT